MQKEINNIIGDLESTADNATQYIRDLCQRASDIIQRLNSYNEEVQSMMGIYELAIENLQRQITAMNTPIDTIMNMTQDELHIQIKRLTIENEKLIEEIDCLNNTITHLSKETNYLMQRVEVLENEVKYCDHCGKPMHNTTDIHVVEKLPIDINSANAGESATLCGVCHSLISNY